MPQLTNAACFFVCHARILSFEILVRTHQLDPMGLIASQGRSGPSVKNVYNKNNNKKKKRKKDLLTEFLGSAHVCSCDSESHVVNSMAARSDCPPCHSLLWVQAICVRIKINLLFQQTVISAAVKTINEISCVSNGKSDLFDLKELK